MYSNHAVTLTYIVLFNVASLYVTKPKSFDCIQSKYYRNLIKKMLVLTSSSDEKKINHSLRTIFKGRSNRRLERQVHATPTYIYLFILSCDARLK